MIYETHIDVICDACRKELVGFDCTSCAVADLDKKDKMRRGIIKPGEAQTPPPSGTGEITQLKKPSPESFGWIETNGFDGEPSGWCVEHGEEAYNQALKAWESQQLQAELTRLRAVGEAVGDILSTLKKADNEITSAPWWLIIDPRQNFNTNNQGFHNIAHMITGPFFSREDAEEFLKRTRYNFGPNAKVYCHSGTYSDKYVALYQQALKGVEGGDNGK